jgi:7,8-dihydropterin-6-yl-methyl-4-(beta-D-ribofuranosyl)aminobenzene 5'-phosphate synthase
MIKSVDVTITVLFDNYLHRDDLTALWGFSAYIELPGKTILFDTGSNGRVLLRNAKLLRKEIGKVDTLFLTHHHWDHIGGLDSVIERHPGIDIVAPSSLSPRLIRDLRSMVRSVDVVEENAQEVIDGVYTTGMMGEEVQEQSLVIDTDEGLIVITGCAHGGIVEIAERAKAMLGKEVLLLVGGFHLADESEERILKVIDALEKLGVTYVSPTHCSGERAIEMFSSAFGAKYIPGGAGKIITFPHA